LAREFTVKELPTPRLPPTWAFPVIPNVAPEILFVTCTESSTAADPEVRDPPTPAFPVTERDEPIPTKPSNLDTPLTLNVSEGDEVPIPNLLVVELK
jgi:hypothetical protein